MSSATRPPSVDALARELAGTGLPHPLLVDIAREAIAAGEPASAAARAARSARRLLGPVVNATGVLLHTNLGRAPVAHQQPARYSNLEFDLETGARGSRHVHAGGLLARACGAESALVVNNGASAVLLVLASLAQGRGAVVSRGELVEIGGGFRVPEVMAQSGANLVEVGTTNRTRRADYERAVASTPDIALVMKVHQSNYRITGFTEEASVQELADLPVPVVADIGSGLLDARTPWLGGGAPPPWLDGEPAARQTLEAGAALVIFSGDKLLGGPQAGIIAGRADLVDACARHPVARAVRAGGLVLGALQETALAYLRRDGDAIPFWRLAAADLSSLESRARAMVEAAGTGSVVGSEAVPGGGTLPGVTIASAAVRVDGDILAGLRDHSTPVVARVHEGATLVDVRSVFPEDDTIVVEALRAAHG